MDKVIKLARIIVMAAIALKIKQEKSMKGPYNINGFVLQVLKILNWK